MAISNDPKDPGYIGKHYDRLVRGDGEQTRPTPPVIQVAPDSQPRHLEEWEKLNWKRAGEAQGEAPQLCEHGKLLIGPCEPCGREPLDIDGDWLVSQRTGRVETGAHPSQDDLELQFRQELWLQHGHFAALYGDDGELQCAHPDCRWDFKREDMQKTIEHVKKIRLARARSTPSPDPPPPDLSAERFFSTMDGAWNDFMSYTIENDATREEIFKFAEAYANHRVERLREALRDKENER